MPIRNLGLIQFFFIYFIGLPPVPIFFVKIVSFLLVKSIPFRYLLTVKKYFFKQRKENLNWFSSFCNFVRNRVCKFILHISNYAKSRFFLVCQNNWCKRISWKRKNIQPKTKIEMLFIYTHFCLHMIQSDYECTVPNEQQQW